MQDFLTRPLAGVPRLGHIDSGKNRVAELQAMTFEQRLQAMKDDGKRASQRCIKDKPPGRERSKIVARLEARIIAKLKARGPMSADALRLSLRDADLRQIQNRICSLRHRGVIERKHLVKGVAVYGLT